MNSLQFEWDEANLKKELQIENHKDRRKKTVVNKDRVWLEVAAKIDPEHGTLTAEVPEPDFAYGFFYVTDHREVSASSPIWVKEN